jgi:hypothetical protein
MKPYSEDDELTNYVWNHYSCFLTPVELKASWAVLAEQAAKTGNLVVSEFLRRRHQLAADPAVVEAIADGIELFRHRTAHRILRDHFGEIYVNRCAKCNRVVRTPKAQQCLWCGHDWHPNGSAARPGGAEG